MQRLQFGGETPHMPPELELACLGADQRLISERSMHDPIGAFTQIRELYLSDLDTSFRIEDQGVAEEHQELFRSAGALSTDPLLGPQPEWAKDERQLKDLLHEQGDQAVLAPLSPHGSAMAFSSSAPSCRRLQAPAAGLCGCGCAVSEPRLNRLRRRGVPAFHRSAQPAPQFRQA